MVPLEGVRLEKNEYSSRGHSFDIVHDDSHGESLHWHCAAESVDDLDWLVEHCVPMKPLVMEASTLQAENHAHSNLASDEWSTDEVIVNPLASTETVAAVAVVGTVVAAAVVCAVSDQEGENSSSIDTIATGVETEAQPIVITDDVVTTVADDESTLAAQTNVSPEATETLQSSETAAVLENSGDSSEAAAVAVLAMVTAAIAMACGLVESHAEASHGAVHADSETVEENEPETQLAEQEAADAKDSSEEADSSVQAGAVAVAAVAAAVVIVASATLLDGGEAEMAALPAEPSSGNVLSVQADGVSDCNETTTMTETSTADSTCVAASSAPSDLVVVEKDPVSEVQQQEEADESETMANVLSLVVMAVALALDSVTEDREVPADSSEESPAAPVSPAVVIAAAAAGSVVAAVAVSASSSDGTSSDAKPDETSSNDVVVVVQEEQKAAAAPPLATKEESAPVQQQGRHESESAKAESQPAPAEKKGGCCAIL
jgi:hypothetical protein